MGYAETQLGNYASTHLTLDQARWHCADEPSLLFSTVNDLLLFLTRIPLESEVQKLI